MLSRRTLLIGSLASVACGRGKSGGGITDPSSSSPGTIAFEVAFRPSAMGFFCLYDAGRLLAGTYGPPRVYTGDGRSFSDISGAASGAGESIFDITSFGGSWVAATENSGQLYKGGRSVFRAGGDWNNAYSIVDAGGTLLTGFNEFPANRRTLVCLSSSGDSWQTYILGGIHHTRFGYLNGLAYAVGLRVNGGIEVLRSADLRVWETIAQVRGSFPSRMRSVSGSLFFGVENDGTVYRVSGSNVSAFGQVGESRLFGEVFGHNGIVYAVVGSGWHGSGRSSLWEVGSQSKEVALFPEAEGWCGLSYGGHIYVGTRSDRGDGKLYRSK